MRISDWSSDVCSSDLIYAVGGNENAATLTGVPVRPIKVAVYVLSSLTAGIAAVLMVGWLGAVTNGLGLGAELRVIASSVIGGANLMRSEEHTSELQSLMRTSYAVFCLQKKKERSLKLT